MSDRELTCPPLEQHHFHLHHLLMIDVLLGCGTFGLKGLSKRRFLKQRDADDCQHLASRFVFLHPHTGIVALMKRPMVSFARMLRVVFMVGVAALFGSLPLAARAGTIDWVTVIP